MDNKTDVEQNNLGLILGDIGCVYRNNINAHVKDYRLQKEDGNMEWLLEPLDAISHAEEIVLDIFDIESERRELARLYFHARNATQLYVPFDKPFKKPEGVKRIGNTIIFRGEDEIEKVPAPNPFDKAMLIQEPLNIYARDAIPSIWDELLVQFTEVGIWQALLLKETKVPYPQGYYPNYCVYSKADMQQIIDNAQHKYYDFTDAEFDRLEAYYRSLGRNPVEVSRWFKFRKADHERLASFINRDDIMPSVEVNGDKAVVTYCYWSDWEGFCRKIIPVEKYNQTVIFGESDRKVFVEYDCGIIIN